MRRTATTLTLLCLSLPALARGQDASTEVAAGKKVYRKVCEECHGRQGHGDGEKARSMGFRARDFSRGSFKCRCTPTGALPTDEDLLRTLGEGLPGTPMLAQPDLSPDELRAVVAFVKTLVPSFATETAPACIDIPEPPADLLAGVSEGRVLYRLLGCQKCHGPAGAADGPSAGALVDSWNDPIKVHNFVRAGKFKCGGEPADLYRTLHTGMNGSPMPSFTTALAFAREEVANLDAITAEFGAAGAEEARAYLDAQPDRQGLAALDHDAREKLVERRTWSLVAYLQSLAQR
jgi:mono/diheme cytochrome c family protein